MAPRLLLIRSLDDLTERLAKVVFLILIVPYFEYALQATIAAPLDLLYLAIGIVLISAALYLSSRGPHVAPQTAPKRQRRSPSSLRASIRRMRISLANCMLITRLFSSTTIVRRPTT